ncbi:Amino acid permease [Pediococcus damnosus]|uniref:APC family permease n=1 Tax=Pediococcus damnosus TaxID=51663 RepID=UPI00078DF145|nr:amino acid permease [Pediococcus damnosus]AMV70017.1 Amino acid permease [Pediococcus damnosus]
MQQNHVLQKPISISAPNNQTVKHNLSRTNLFMLSVGQIAGAGILSMLGIAVGMTGRSIFISFILAAFLILATLIPIVLTSGTVRLPGGDYSRAALLAGKKWAGMYIFIFAISNFSISMYALSFADYLLALIPGLPHQAVALGILTLVFIFHYFGIKNAARWQTLIIILLSVALTMFTVLGLPHVQPGYFQQPGFMTHGGIGILAAAAYMTFTVGGAQFMINFSDEAKNPTKDIPFVMVISTITVAILYALMAVVASGVLPLHQVINQPLTHVANAILSRPLYIFFVIGGALIALTGTMNASIGSSLSPIVQASRDGWFPKQMGYLHPKYNSPVVILGIFYLIGILPIIFGWNISLISNSVLILTNVVSLVLAISTIRLPQVMPEQWAKSAFHVSNRHLIELSLFSAATMIVQLVMFFRSISTTAVIGNVFVVVLAYLFGVWRTKYVTMDLENIK